MAEPMEVRGKELVITVSAGIALAHEGLPSDELIDLADQALYDAKRSGGGRIGSAPA